MISFLKALLRQLVNTLTNYIAFVLRLLLPPQVLDKILFRPLLIRNNSNKILFSILDFGPIIRYRYKTFWTKEPETLDWINHFPQNSLLIDVGANIGLYSLYAASKGHTVLAFEPQSHNYSLLNSNIILNNFQDKILAFPVCIHSESKLSTLHLTDADFGSAHNSFHRQLDQYGNQLGVTIPQGSISISLNSLLNQYANRTIFLKIDVDGNEDFVIQGAERLLSSNSLKGILVELDLTRPDYSYIFNTIVDAGFNLDPKFSHYIQNPLPSITTYNHIFNKA
tara:strand:- start:4642 stop:5484 length:843 start_codon:yes stop_codon:yes gene_type:complete